MGTQKTLKQYIKLLESPRSTLEKLIKKGSRNKYEFGNQEIKQTWLPFFEDFQQLHDFANSEDYAEYKNDKRGYNDIGRAYFRMMAAEPIFADYRYLDVYQSNFDFPISSESTIEVQNGDDSCSIASQGSDFIVIAEDAQTTTGNISNFESAEVCGLNGDDIISGNSFNNNLFGGIITFE